MLKKLFTVIIILSPILSIYRIQATSLSIADILLIIIIPLLLIDFIRSRKFKLNDIIVQFLIIILYMIMQLLFLNVFNSIKFKEVLMPTLRLLFYYSLVAIFLKRYFDKEFGLKLFKNVSIFASLFLLLQFFVLQFTGKYIPGYIKLPGIEIEESLQEHALNVDSSGRVRSLFREPSHYAIYCGLYLAIELLAKSKKINMTVIIITVAMLVSTSGTAILLTCILYIIFFVKNSKTILRNHLPHFLLTLTLIIMIFCIYMTTEHFDLFVRRTFTEGSSTRLRFENYSLIFENNEETVLTKIFGNCILKIKDYIPSIPRIYFYFGAIGLIYFTFMFIHNFKTKKGINLISNVVLFILMIPTEIFFGVFILLYAPFMYIDFENKSEDMAIQT